MKIDNWKLIRGARQVLTLRQRSGTRRGREPGELGVIEDGSVLIRNDVINAVGPRSRIENMTEARNAEEIDASGRLVMPAFVDCQACLVTSPVSRADEKCEVTRDAIAKSVEARPANRLEMQADELLKMMACHGTGTVAALSGYGFDATGEYKILRSLRALNERPLDVMPVLSILSAGQGLSDGQGEEQQKLWAGEDFLHSVFRRKLASVASAQCGNGGVPLVEAEPFLLAAQAIGFGIRMEMLEPHEAGLVQAAVKLKALSITATGRLRAAEIDLLSQSSTYAILLPALMAKSETSSLERGGFERAGYGRELADNGVRIALGSGVGPEHAATASMQTTVQLACEVLGLSLAEAIAAATIDAAWALGMEKEVGSLEHGKRADLIVLNASDYREIPRLAGTNLMHSMLKRGVVIFEERFPGWPTEI